MLSARVIAGRSQNRDTAERVQDQQVSVAGDNSVGAPVNSQLKKFVFLGVAAGVDRGRYLDEFACARMLLSLTAQVHCIQRRQALSVLSGPAPLHWKQELSLRTRALQQ